MHAAGERPLVALPPAGHAPHEVAAAQARRRRDRWWAWTRACAVGETLGPVLAALVTLGLAAAGRHEPTAVELPIATAVVVTCAAGGALVASAQWRTLSQRFPDVPARAWWAATVTGTAATVAAICVAIASGASSPRVDTALLVGTVAWGAVAGVFVGVAQWFALRRGTRRAHEWIGANALAWAAAMPLVLVAARVATSASSGVEVLTGLGGALGAGLLVAAITGRAFVRLPPRLHLVRGGARPAPRHAPQQSSG